MSKITILRGLPGSGKSTLCKKFYPDHVIASRDALRRGMFGRYTNLSFEEEKLVTVVQERIVREAVKAGHDVVIDDMNLRPKYVKRWISLANDLGALHDIVEMHTPLDKCIEQDASPERQTMGKVVGDATIRKIYNKFTVRGEFLPVGDIETVSDSQFSPYVKPETYKPDAIIVDIDGTVALHPQRGHYDYSKVLTDEVNTPIVNIVSYVGRNVNSVIFVSGREDRCREDTVAWINRAFGWEPADYLLYMRKTDDHRPDDTVKNEIFEKNIAGNYDILAVFDDRDRVVDMWREKGLTCLQVADGNF